MTPAAHLPLLKRVMVVSDAGSDAALSALITLLRKSGVTVGAASLEVHSKPVTAPELPAVLNRDVHSFHPNVAIIAAPSGDISGIHKILVALPSKLALVWAQDPTGKALKSLSLSRPAGQMLSRYHHLTVVSPGAVLNGISDVARRGRLTASGTTAYAESLLDVVGAAYRLPRLPPAAAESPDAAGYVAVAAAESRLGDPYVWAAAGPSTFDCSGLVMWAWEHAGVSLPHYSGAQFEMTTRVPMDALEPGDLLFPADPGEHVAMYVGDGKIIQAPETGEDVEIVSLKSTHHFFRYATQVTVDVQTGQITAESAQSFALSILRATPGWGVGQWAYLEMLWNRESGWRVNATNPTSGAYGIPQSLPATKMAAAGSDWRTNAQTQIRWGLGYIHSRYGSPKQAWYHELTFGWY